MIEEAESTDRLSGALEAVAQATGAVVSLYEGRGARVLGPFHAHPLGGLLAESKAWSAGGWAWNIESDLVGRALARQTRVDTVTAPGLAVAAIPAVGLSGTRLVSVFGWSPQRFPSEHAATLLAGVLGRETVTVWRVFRSTKAITPDLFDRYCQLVDTLVGTSVRNDEARVELVRLMQMREVLLAKVSHELRSPLSAISLRADALALGVEADEERRRSHIGSIKRNVAEMSRLVEDLLESGRSQTGLFSVSKSLVDPLSPLTAAIEAALPQARVRGISLNTFIPEALKEGRLFIHADADRVQQIYSNVFGNALKFTPAGGTVSVRVRFDSGWVVVSVADSGRGMNADEVSRIFDDYIRTDQMNPTGIGLGMSIAKQLARLHGGEISASSDGPGRGSEITVSLPLASEGAGSGGQE